LERPRVGDAVRDTVWNLDACVESAAEAWRTGVLAEADACRRGRREEDDTLRVFARVADAEVDSLRFTARVRELLAARKLMILL
jgi:hypothetical protein